MPRPLVLGNGSLLVAMDADLSIRDFTFPYVGLLNHLSGHRIRIGVWVQQQFAWLDDPRWRKRLGYEPDTLVTAVHCEHPDLRLELDLSDCVSHRENLLLRRFRLTNRAAESREARLFLSHDFHIAETDIGDTAFYNPYVDAVVHYKRDNYFLISGTSALEGLFQYTCGVKGFGGAEGTWRDAEDGWLSMNPVEQGSVDSTISFRTIVPPGETATIHAWVCAGPNLAEVTRQHHYIIFTGFEELRQHTADYWVAWSHNESEAERLLRLPPQVAELFRRSLLIIRTQVDNHGAILAANDSDILETARAHYSYMWPRDGALVTAALDQLGYQDITRRFFRFCRNILPKDRPALLHKYSADGSWGATWHPWRVGDHNEVPFQQDSTALVLWALWRHYARYRDLEFVESLYYDLVIPASDFMVQYRNPETHLPLPSYDLWEERRGVHAYTCGTVYAALDAAARLAQVFRDERAQTYSEAAEQLRVGIVAHLWDEKAARYARRLIVHPDGTLERDLTIDSAVFALFAFGAFPATDARIASTMQQTLSRLTVQTPVGGMARYENDYYFRRSDDFTRVPGSPWIICTLWAAQYYIATATTPADLEKALALLTWVTEHAAESGVLSEQVHPLTGQPLSVSPLTWSHAEFVSTTLQYLDRATG
jgi:GH15 family glucan-1,4-alpha-glucosidase